MGNNYERWKIGLRIKNAREHAQLSQAALGERIGYGYQMIGKWERGETIPSLDSLLSLCDVFECELGYLLGEHDCYTRAATDIQALTGLSEQAIKHIKHNGEKRLKDGYYDLSHGVQKKLLNAFLESPEFASVMLQLRLYYALATTADNTHNALEDVEFTGNDLAKAERVAESIGSVIVEKRDAAESFLSIAAEYFKQFARKAVEQRSGE